MTKIAENVADINQFIAETVLAMDEETRDAWDSLSLFERKTIAFAAWAARNTVRRQNFLDLRFNLKAAS